MTKISLKPSLTYEQRHQGRIAGVDEAGRGPLAGPVVAAAVILDLDHIPDGLDDSKKLSAARRTILFGQILTVSTVGIGIAEPQDIDRLNILGATMAAMGRAISDLEVRPDFALIDGNRLPPLPMAAQTIVKGDSKSLSIAAASIIAKVTRDRLMQHASLAYPEFGFERHKGYPTKAHRDILTVHGPCPIHRRGFAPVKRALISINERLKS